MSDRNLSKLEQDNYLNYYKTALSKWLKSNINNSSSNELRIGLWGTTGAGKTTYLTMLFSYLEDSTNWDVVVDKNARRFIEKNIYYLEEEYVFPPPTNQFKELDIISYTLIPQSPKIAKSNIVLNFIDAPGEFYEDIINANAKVVDNSNISEKSNYPRSEDKQRFMDIIDYLISCDCIIFLLDPDRTQKDGSAYSTLLRNLFFELKERAKLTDVSLKRLPQYMAFCVTKVDRQEFWDNGANSGLNSKELIQKIMGKQTLHKLENNYCTKGRYGFFSMSSIGRYQDSLGNFCEAVIYPDLEDINQEFIQSDLPSNQQDNSEKSEYNDSFIEQFSVENTPVRNSRFEIKNESNSLISESKQNLRATIKPDVILKPIGIIDPINWLITKIKFNSLSR